jgi:hypothetical protein
MHGVASGVNNLRVEELYVASVRDEHPFHAGPSNDMEHLYWKLRAENLD